MHKTKVGRPLFFREFRLFFTNWWCSMYTRYYSRPFTENGAFIHIACNFKRTLRTEPMFVLRRPFFALWTSGFFGISHPRSQFLKSSINIGFFFHQSSIAIKLFYLNHIDRIVCQLCSFDTWTLNRLAGFYFKPTFSIDWPDITDIYLLIIQ